MRIPIRASLMALSLATLMAGPLGVGSRRAAAQGDPVNDGIIAHAPAEADPNILADPRTLKGGRSGAAPAPAMPVATRAAPATATAPSTESATTGPEAAAPADTQEYTIKLNRPAVAGQTYDMQASAEQSQTNSITAAGATTPTVDTKAMKATLSGRLAVVSVDDQGEMKEFNLTVTKFDIDGKEAVPEGKVINGKHDKTFTYTIASGETVSDPAKDALGLVFDEGPDSMVPFESKSPQKVGDSWPVDSDAAAKALAKDGTVTIDPKKIAGQVTFKGVETPGGAKALRIEATMTATDMKMADPSMTLDSSKLEGQFSGLFPVDTTQPPVDDVSTVDMTMHVSAPVKLDTTMHVMTKETLTPVK